MMRSRDMTSTAFRQFVDGGRPPVILQVLAGLNAGGAEQSAIDINAAILRAGGKSIVVTAGGTRIHEITKPGGIHIILPLQSKNPLVLAANSAKLRKIIRQYNVDVVHAAGRAPAWVAARAVQGTTARLITSCHAAHAAGGKIAQFYNAAIAKGERVIAISHFLADYLEKNYKLDPNIIRVIHRGVAIERFHPNAVTPERLVSLSRQMRIPDGAAVILLPARVSRKQGHMFLLDAIEQLGRRDVFCLFVGADLGDEAYSKELEAYISAKGLGPQVRIEPQCNDMPAAYMIATVVAVPSVEPEGFGRVPIEAQAMGRPCIATDHGGTKETVVRDETGWLVPPGDVTALKNALHEALTLDARGRAMLATRAMSHVAEHFTNDQMCQGTLDVYAELLADARRNPVPLDARAVAG